eukprot:5659108-Karenia_brevis.AAC.1
MPHTVQLNSTGEFLHVVYAPTVCELLMVAQTATDPKSADTDSEEEEDLTQIILDEVSRTFEGCQTIEVLYSVVGEDMGFGTLEIYQAIKKLVQTKRLHQYRGKGGVSSLAVQK